MKLNKEQKQKQLIGSIVFGVIILLVLLGMGYLIVPALRKELGL